MGKLKNDKAWEEIFDKFNILDAINLQGYALITSSDINTVREARLMTKFDHKSQLPKLFVEYGLSILPTSRGGYVIGTFDTFVNFNIDDVEVTPIEFPTFLESLDYKDITSESTAINCAFVSKILHDFTGEENLVPTVSGRMGSSSFSFDIHSLLGPFKINVENSQIEIDGGFEGDNTLNIIEAKNYISDDFLVRQLFYPYKLWSSKVQKKVCPIFLTYSNGVFHLREYSFLDNNHYNSINLVKHKKYVVQDGAFNLETLQNLLNKVEEVKEPKVPFPQADNFERVINLCELLNQKEFLTKEEITQNYDFDARQTDYYSNAARYLGFVSTGRDAISGQVGCFLTESGKQIFQANLIERQEFFVNAIISHSVFKQVLLLYLEYGEMPSRMNIVQVMMESNLYKLKSQVTYARRASTIAGWINWIMNQIEE
jgi:hypothetical protein